MDWSWRKNYLCCVIVQQSWNEKSSIASDSMLLFLDFIKLDWNVMLCCLFFECSIFKYKNKIVEWQHQWPTETNLKHNIISANWIVLELSLTINHMIFVWEIVISCWSIAIYFALLVFLLSLYFISFHFILFVLHMTWWSFHIFFFNPTFLLHIWYNLLHFPHFDAFDERVLPRESHRIPAQFLLKARKWTDIVETHDHDVNGELQIMSCE